MKMQDSPVEQTFRDTERKLREKIERLEHQNQQLRINREDMYFLATRAEFDVDDWNEFERLFNKQF
jgi:uncharacterized protein (UPF0335 family)